MERRVVMLDTFDAAVTVTESGNKPSRAEPSRAAQRLHYRTDRSLLPEDGSTPGEDVRCQGEPPRRIKGAELRPLGGRGGGAGVGVTPRACR